MMTSEVLGSGEVPEYITDRSNVGLRERSQERLHGFELKQVEASADHGEGDNRGGTRTGKGIASLVLRVLHPSGSAGYPGR